MLTLTGLGKTVGARTLFAEVSLSLVRTDRIGLVGPNGSGKTTLFSLILGRELPDAGAIQLQRGVTIGHLPQESAPAGNETVLELAMAVTPEVEQLQAQVAGRGTERPLSAEGFQLLQDHFETLGGHHLEPKAKTILQGLAFRESDFNRPVRTLSGGWVMRAYLARLLVLEPDLLLLDEPTNHLDLETLQWFQEYLKHYPGAILMISHDRDFLNQLIGSVWEIRQERLYRYTGDFDAYLQQRELQILQQEAAYKNQQRKIQHLQDFIDRFRAKATKASQAQSKLKQLDRMERIEAPEGAEATVDFSFPQPVRSGLRVIALKEVDHAYGDQVIYRGLNFQAERGQRIVLVGPNGAGKSTLLKLLAGVLPVQAGVRELGYQVRSGYYAQYRTETLHLERTVLEEALDTPQRVTELFVREVLGSFLFRGDDVFKKVSVLSGGEKSRLALVRLLLDPPNLLLMDEPTTHLDLASVDALIWAMEQYSGTIIFISHDVHFIRSIANHVVHVRHGVLTHYPGEYQYYVDRMAALAAAEAARALSEGSPKSAEPARNTAREQKRAEAAQRQARYQERVVQRKLVKELEDEIAQLEQEQTDLTAELQDPKTYADSSRVVAINREVSEGRELLDQLTVEWESAATRLTELEADE